MNRTLIGIRRELKPDFKITLGYQNILDLLSSGGEFNVIHALTIGIILNSILND